MASQPVAPVGPPASGTLVGIAQPVFGITGHITMLRRNILRPIATTLFGRRVDDAGYMARSAQNKTYGAAQNIAACIRRMPGNDMIFSRAVNIGRHGQRAEV